MRVHQKFFALQSNYFKMKILQYYIYILAETLVDNLNMEFIIKQINKY